MDTARLRLESDRTGWQGSTHAGGRHLCDQCEPDGHSCANNPSCMLSTADSAHGRSRTLVGDDHHVAGVSDIQMTIKALQNRPRHLVSARGMGRPATWLVEMIVLDLAVAGNSVWLLRFVAVLLLAVLPGRLLLRALENSCSVYPPVRHISALQLGCRFNSHHPDSRSCRASARSPRTAPTVAVAGRAKPGSTRPSISRARGRSVLRAL